MNIYCYDAIFIKNLLIVLSVATFSKSQGSDETKSVLAVISFQNEEIVLPYFLSFFQRLTYPKNKISLFIRSGNSFDRSNDVIRAWIEKNGQNYLSVDLQLEDWDWVLKNPYEEALMESRRNDYDYLWILDPNGFLTNEDVLHKLIAERLPIVAPLLNAVSKYYSNFWGKISSNFWYERSEDYLDIVRREKQGCLKAELLNSFFLIDMNNENSKYVTFNASFLTNYIGPMYPPTVLAAISKLCQMDQYICNQEEHGVLIPDFDSEDLMAKFEYLEETKVYLHSKKIPHRLSEEFLPYLFLPPTDNLGFDKVYVINLARHAIRKQIMTERLMYTGLNATFFEGIDGELLNSRYLSSIGFKPLDDCTRSSLSMREIGWSLSHYSIWDDVIRSNYSRVIVLEDNIVFNNNFRHHLEMMLNETDEILLDYDLIYLCRVIVNAAFEDLIYDAIHLTNVEFSNMACGYILTQEGARKLRQEQYISNLIPVDEYLITKYASKANRQPEYAKRAHFLPDLKAYSIYPLAANPVLHSTNDTDPERSDHNEPLETFFNKVGEANVAVASKY